MSVHHVTQLLVFCLHSTYFLFQGQYCEQREGATMRSAVSPIAANIYINKFENKAIRTAESPQKLWKRYVDDTFIIQDPQHKDKFLPHINSIDK